MRRIVLTCLLLLRSSLVPSLAVAATSAPVAMESPRVWRAATGNGDEDGSIRITFLGHASFEIVSPKGVRAVTDYNGMNLPAAPPDIATMNDAHSTHYTLNPDPGIQHVLHGWSEDGKMPVIDLRVDDMHVTNVPTNIRKWTGTVGRSVKGTRSSSSRAADCASRICRICTICWSRGTWMHWAVSTW